MPLVEEANKIWAHLATTEINTLVMALIEPIISKDAVTFLQLVTEMYPVLDIAGYAFALADRNRIAREWSLFKTAAMHSTALGISLKTGIPVSPACTMK